MTDIPTVVTAAGLQPTPPATLQQAIIDGVTPTNPDYTSNLPGSLIEDILDTNVLALSLIDQAKVELVNSLTPYGANDFLLTQLGNQAGVSLQGATNTSVYVVFEGTPGFVIVTGFTVSDGTYQYVVQDGGIIGTSGYSQPLYAVATQSGSWAVPSGTVTQTVTSVPTGISCTVNNPTAGTAGGAAQSNYQFRQAVLQANLAVAQGVPSFTKTLIGQAPNVQQNLVSMRQQTAGGWEIIVGGGDPYEVGYAIFQGVGDISLLEGSVYNITAIGDAYPCAITTDKNHGYTTGQVVTMSGITGTGNLTNLNNVNYPATVTGPTSFTVPFTPTEGSVYDGGGVVAPNLRNVTVAIQDYPDVYSVIFVNPPSVQVTMTITWNTISSSFVSAASVAQLASAAVADYVNSIEVGQPLNLLEVEAAFLAAIEGIVSTNLISSLTISVSINGTGVEPVGQLIYAEPNSTVQESYFTTNSGLITVVQG